MKPAPQPFLAEALDRLWAQFLPQMEERVGILESASALLSAGTLSLAECQRANAAAHKLAGVLGTFGLTKGTILAREAEILYSTEPDSDPEMAARLSAIAVQLRAIVAGRK
jgi:HPt (histidine-containing phosphotransfer) domain-containing protein